MLNKILKEAFIIVVGKQSGDIIDFLDTKKYVNEFIIAKKLDITINQTRNILYRLSDNGMVSSIRKKDKKKGWYTYFWKVEALKSLGFFRNILIKRIEQIMFQIKSRESKNFYICELCKIEFNEETALVYDFTCNECGNIFVMKDNTRALNDFNKSLEKLKRKLKLVDVEIEKEKEKMDKKRLREIKNEEKEKANKRALAREKRKAAKKSKAPAKEKAKKKVVKKKVVKTKTPVKKKIVKKNPAKKKVVKAKKAIKKKVVKKVVKKVKKVVKKVKKKK